MKQIRLLYKTLVAFIIFGIYCRFICFNHHKTQDVDLDIGCVIPEKGCKLFDTAWRYTNDLDYGEGKW